MRYQNRSFTVLLYGERGVKGTPACFVISQQTLNPLVAKGLMVRDLPGASGTSALIYVVLAEYSTDTTSETPTWRKARGIFAPHS